MHLRLRMGLRGGAAEVQDNVGLGASHTLSFPYAVLPIPAHTRPAST
jgi:hypothetical protein